MEHYVQNTTSGLEITLVLVWNTSSATNSLKFQWNKDSDTLPPWQICQGDLISDLNIMIGTL